MNILEGKQLPKQAFYVILENQKPKKSQKPQPLRYTIRKRFKTVLRLSMLLPIPKNNGGI